MPVQVSYPGVYIEEIPSSPTTVTSATTSATAFADFFLRGPMGQAVQVNNLSDFQRMFGGLDQRSEASYGIMQYFNNGGQTAWVVRLGDGSAKVAQVAVPVNVPAASTLSNEAASAAAAAAQAAQKAQQATAQPQPFDAASQAAAATEQAAQLTLQAASATDAMSQELQADIDQFSAKYGSEAGATRDAAQAAADAAAAAAEAAQAASTAAAAAAAAASPLAKAPANNAVTQAAADTGTSTSSGTANTQKAAVAALSAPLAAAETTALATAAGSGDYSKVKIGETGTAATAFANAQKVQTDLASAISGTKDATALAQLQGLQAPVVSLLGAASAALQSASGATAAANGAVTDVSGAATDPPTVSVNTVANHVMATVSAAQDLGGKASSLATTAANALAALNQSGLALSAAPGSTLQADLVALAGDSTASPPTTGSAGALQQSAGATLGWAEWTETAVTNWQAAAEEPDNLTDAGAAAAATAAQGNANAAKANASSISTAASADQIKALYPGGSGTPDLPTMITQLGQAASDFGNAAAGQPVDLSTDLTNLKAVAAAAAAGWTAAAAGSSGSGKTAVTFPASLQNLVATFAATAEGAYLSGLIAQDLAVAMAPVDTAQSATVAAAAAARDAALKAAVAASKARIAELAAQQDAADAGNQMTLAAANPGTWGNNLQVKITSRPGYQFDLTVQEMAVRNGQLKAVNTESYSGLTLGSSHAANYAVAVVNSQSQLVQLAYGGITIQGTYPAPTPDFEKLAGGANGGPPRASDLFPALSDALDDIAPSTFNLLCLPITATYSAGAASQAITQAMSYAGSQHAFYIVDIPANVDTVSKMQSWASSYTNAAAYNAAVYFPRLLMPDPLQNYRARNVGASGTMAGIYARNDVDYGVWETPAGINAVIENAQMAVKLTDPENGTLNPLGINCLRTFPVYGNVVWGGRTMAGADQIGSQWKYLNVRRLADYIEQSLFQSLRWVVFQNNDPRLWSQIRAQVGSFMSGLFSAGAFAGGSADQAYLVRCDATTTTQTDIDNGIVNILVGFAPEKPAEFVVLQIEQLAGQTAS